MGRKLVYPEANLVILNNFANISVVPPKSKLRCTVLSLILNHLHKTWFQTQKVTRFIKFSDASATIYHRSSACHWLRLKQFYQLLSCIICYYYIESNQTIEFLLSWICNIHLTQLIKQRKNCGVWVHKLLITCLNVFTKSRVNIFDPQLFSQIQLNFLI